MTQILLWMYSLLHHEQVSVHFVHIADWEDQAHIATFGTPLPNGLSTVFNFHARVLFTLTQLRGIVIPGLTSHGSNCLALWCLRLHLSLSTAPTPTASGLLFLMDLKDNIYFAIVLLAHSYMTSALFVFCLGLSNNPPAIYIRQLVLILNSMVVCLLTMKVMSPLLLRTTWKLDDTTGYQTCLIKASIDSRVFKYPEHSDTLPHINPIGKISQEFACNWNTDDAPPDFAFFVCS